MSFEISKYIDPEVEKTKSAAWSGFGVELYRKEIEFQLISQQIISKLIIPTTPEELKAAEDSVAIVKKELEALVEKRKVPTEHFKKVAQRLMQPEKNVNEAVEKALAAILKVKQEKKNTDTENQNKQKELLSIAEQTRVYVSDMHSSILKALAKLINDAYTHALEKEIPADKIQAFVDKVIERVNTTTTATPPPKPKFKYNTQEDVDAEVAKYFNPWQPQQYIDGFKIDIEKKFFDWQLALKNKPQAAKLNADEYAETVTAIDDLNKRETVTAKLDSISMPVAEAADVKPLKEKWIIEEPQTIEQAQKIIDAFSVNRNLTHPELRKITPVKLSVKQMMTALEDVKNKDNNFEVTGILFKKVDKL